MHKYIGQWYTYLKLQVCQPLLKYVYDLKTVTPTTFFNKLWICFDCESNNSILISLKFFAYLFSFPWIIYNWASYCFNDSIQCIRIHWLCHATLTKLCEDKPLVDHLQHVHNQHQDLLRFVATCAEFLESIESNRPISGLIFDCIIAPK